MLTDLAFDLSVAGVPVEIVTSRLRYDQPENSLPSHEMINGVHVHRVWTSSFGRSNLVGRAIDYGTFYCAALWKLFCLTDRNTTVVVKTDPPLISLIVAPIAIVRRARYVNWLQDLFPEVASALHVPAIPSFVIGLLRKLRNITLQFADKNIVLGSRMAALVKSEGVPDSRIQIIPNWADGDLVKPIERGVNRLRTEWGFQNKFVVCYSGNLGRAHEFSTILDAAEILKKRMDIVFLFIGGGAQRVTVEQEVQSRQLSAVCFQPYQPRNKLSESLSVADIHLVSLNPCLEGLIVPSKLYGITAVGRPTIFIGDKDGEVAITIKDGNCGGTVKVGSSQELASAVAEYADDSAKCHLHGVNARALFDSKFSRTISTAKWLEALV